MRLFSLCAILAWAAAVPAAEVDPAVLKAEAARVAVMEKAKKTVLAVFASSGQGGGSGVVISPDGFALTNFHVVQPCGNAMKCGMSDGKAYDAVIVGIDPTGDVALIKLVGRDDFPAAELGNSDELQTGDSCFAMGNPFLLATDYQPTTTFGLVSGVHRYQPPSGTLLEYTDCIQTDASINPGNSGGPLFNDKGQLIGINGRGSFEKRGRVNVGVAYAISINQIKHFLGQLHSGRIVDHATLGATVGFDDRGRVVVIDIKEESDAARRGLQLDDELVSFAGRPISSPNAFKNVLGIYPKGWRVPITFRHEGKEHNIIVRLEGVHGEAELLEKAAGKPKGLPMPLPDDKDPKGKRPGDKDPRGGKDPKGDGGKPGDDPKKPKFVPKKPDDTTSARVAMTGRVSPWLASDPETPEITPPTPTEPFKPLEKTPDKKDGDKKDNGDKGDKNDKGKPGKPIPIDPSKIQKMLIPPQAPMPEAVKKVFEERKGYSNYYFNRQNRDRVWKAWTKQCDLSGQTGPWAYSGLTQNGNKYRFVITDTDAVLKLPKIDYTWVAGAELTTTLDPPHSGGLLLALHLVRRMNLLGPEKYGDVFYQGTAPLPGRDGMFDVLVGVHKEVKSNFYFDPKTGLLAAVEMFSKTDEDPCELYYSDYRQVDGRMIADTLDTFYGGERFDVFKFTDQKFEKVADK